MKKVKRLHIKVEGIEQTIKDFEGKINELQIKYNDLLKIVHKGTPNSQKLLTVLMDEFIDYLENINIPAHEFREKSPHYINACKRVLKILREVISKKYFISHYRASDINDELVGWFFSELENRGYKNKTFNNMRTDINTFELWLLRKEYVTKRHFDKIRRKPLTFHPEAITKKEFADLLDIIKPETGEHVSNLPKATGRPLIAKPYKPWLAMGFQIALELGARRDEVIAFKFSNVVEEDGKPAFVRIEDTKVNKLRQVKNDLEKKYKALPISKNLLKVLNESGYKKKKGTDEYVLVPEITDPVERHHRIGIVLTESFRYYYRKLNTGRNLSIKSLRVASTTSKFILTGGYAEHLTGHDTPVVVKSHYIDKEALAKHYTKKGYSVFP